MSAKLREAELSKKGKSEGRMIHNCVKDFFVVFTLSGQMALNCEHRVLYVIGIVCVGGEDCCTFVLFRRRTVLNAYAHILRRLKARRGLNIYEI